MKIMKFCSVFCPSYYFLLSLLAIAYKKQINATKKLEELQSEKKYVGLGEDLR